MPGLCTIPPELFSIICSCLPIWEASDGWRAADGAKNEDNFRGINSLSLACKELRCSIEPVLYSTFVKPKFLPWLTGGGPENYTLRSFLRTLLERPELVTHVRTIVLRDWDWDVRHLDGSYRIEELEQPKQRLARLEQAQIQLYMSASSRINLGNSQKMWLRHLYAGHEDAEIALLLTLTSALEHLAMVRPRFEGVDFWPAEHTYLRAVFKEALLYIHGSNANNFAHLKRFTTLVPGFSEVEEPADRHFPHRLHKCFRFPCMVATNGPIDVFVSPGSQLSMFVDNVVQNILSWLGHSPPLHPSWFTDYPPHVGLGWEFSVG